MPGERSTLTVTSPYRRGDVLQVETGANAELLKVLGCAGRGPYTLTVRRYTRLDRVLARLRALMLWPARRLGRLRHDWLVSRCDRPRCWRKAVVEDEDYDE